MAEGEVAQAVLDNLKQLSMPFGVHIEIENNVGVTQAAQGAT